MSFTVPVIDTAPSEPLPGLKFLQNDNKSPYLLAVWDELAHARHPVAICRTFFPDKTSRAVKVDIVAENGARWVRVNTIKNTRLVMEFREIDSYLTSDENEDEDETRAQPEFDNSVLRMGRDLLAAAKANPLSITTSPATTIVPQVTVRLTRLDPFKDSPDPRIGQTLQCLRDMGIDVQLGERPCSIRIPKALSSLQPTMNINLDLSALIALVSDISHSPLPKTQQDAQAQFGLPKSHLDWRRDRAQSLARSDNMGGECNEVENSGQQSRALAAQAIQEMNKGILQAIHERISAHPLTGMTFWTTSEARLRCLRIVSKIGGKRERQRADALLGSSLCSSTLLDPAPGHTRQNNVANIGGMEGKLPGDAYWEHSRYPAGFLPLVPVHVYPSILPAVGDKNEGLGTTSFDSLVRTCTGILSHEAISVSQASVPSDTEEVLEEMTAVATLLPKLTIHTVTSMLAGASRGHTTLTMNRSSVRAMFKQMRSAWWGGGNEHVALLWILDPRSLSEGMRSE